MRTLAAAVALVLCACSEGNPEISAQLAQRVASAGSAAIDLAQLAPPSWERVCAFPPYTNNRNAEVILGFKWDAEEKSKISADDGITFLVFVRGTEVIAYAEHPRNLGDFATLDRHCLARTSAKVVRRARSDGWIQFEAQNAA